MTNQVQLKKTRFLDKDNCLEVFRQLQENSEIPFYQFDRGIECDDKDLEGNKVITWLGAFQLREDYNSVKNKVVVYAIYMMEDPEEIEEYNQKKENLDFLIAKLKEAKDRFEDFDEQLAKLENEYRILHRLNENDNNPDEVFTRPPMQLVMHSEKRVEIPLNKFLDIEIGECKNPTFFELGITKVLLKIRFAQRVRSLDGLYLLKIHEKNKFI